MSATALTLARRAEVPDETARHVLLVLAHFADEAGDVPAAIVDGLGDGRLRMSVAPPHGPAGGQIVVRTADGATIAQIPLCEPQGGADAGADKRGVTP